MASNGVTRPPALDVTMQEILDALKAVSFRPQVIDNLTSQDSGAPLSANQGRVLKDAIDNLVTQSITDGDTSHAPSGDAVYDAINAISTKQTSAIGATPSIETKVSSSSNSVSFSLGGYEAFFLLARGNSMIGEVVIGHTSNGTLTIDLQYGGAFQISFSNDTLTVTNPYDNGIRVTLIKTMSVYE